jgi:hypothetical protein
MRTEDSHLSDQDLLLAADGELSEPQLNQVRGHLATCWDCRTRQGQLEATISRLVHARRTMFDTQLPAAAGRRALLKVRLSEIATGPCAGWSRFTPLFAARRVVAIGLAFASLVIFAVLAIAFRSRIWDSSPRTTQIPLEPSRNLTPGAIRQVSLREVCSEAADEPSARVISVSEQQQVFQEYGMDGAPAKDYEVDFLITPQLGGSNDIHNLWPEPIYSTVWNAHAKDELEDRLHEMVCEGKLDLRTAQRDISQDWIRAYKKYFHTDKPL